MIERPEPGWRERLDALADEYAVARQFNRKGNAQRYSDTRDRIVAEIETLELERSRFLMQALACFSKLPDDMLVGELQAAYRRLKDPDA